MQWISEYTSLVLHFFKIWGLLLFSSFLHSYSFNKNLVPLFYLNFCKYILFHLDIVTCHFSEWPQNKKILQCCNFNTNLVPTFHLIFSRCILFSLDINSCFNVMPLSRIIPNWFCTAANSTQIMYLPLYMFLWDTCFNVMTLAKINLRWVSNVTIKQMFNMKVILVIKWLLLPPSWSTKHQIS